VYIKIIKIYLKGRDMKEELGPKFMKGKSSKKILAESKKLREFIKNIVIKGDIYKPEACINWGGMKSYIPTNFVEYSGIKMEYYYFVMEPGKKVVNHVHPFSDELYFVLGGEGIFGLNGKKYDLCKGVIHHILAGQWHFLDTTDSKANLEIFIVVSPAVPFFNREDGCEGFTEEDWNKMGYGK
jgi:quercetin dioxygenase-like cupin family protein